VFFVPLAPAYDGSTELEGNARRTLRSRTPHLGRRLIPSSRLFSATREISQILSPFLMNRFDAFVLVIWGTCIAGREIGLLFAYPGIFDMFAVFLQISPGVIPARGMKHGR